MTDPSVDFRNFIQRIVDGDTLSQRDAELAMDAIMQGEATPAQIASFITALRVRGETVDEIAGLARAMRSHALLVEPPQGKPIIDTCGTGGDSSGSFNISTTAAFVVAGAGVLVAKHGNRGVTSVCGSADLLEALGVQIEMSPSTVTACLAEAGIGFMFAPVYHPGFRHAGPTRREIGIRTVFNVLGPLCNPAGVKRQLIGVGNLEVAPKLAEAHARLGGERVMVVISEDGLDEFSISSGTTVTEFDGNVLRQYLVTPEDAGLPRHHLATVAGGDAAANAEITRRVLAGEPGAARDVVLLNAGAGLMVAGAADSIAEGVVKAAASIDSGAAQAALENLVHVSNREQVVQAL